MTKEFGVPFKIQSGSKDKKPRWPFVFTLNCVQTKANRGVEFPARWLSIAFYMFF
uniref:Uncharacterized protein n=1 Tax=Anguilla anguilla TaxID=7936 RepID=A0A0E9S4W1_ANGAN